MNTDNNQLVISIRKGYPTAYNGKRHYQITYNTIGIRRELEYKLGSLGEGDQLPDGYYFELTKGLDKIVAKICKPVSSPSPVKEIKSEHLEELREYLEELANESPRANLLLTKLNGYQD